MGSKFYFLAICNIKSMSCKSTEFALEASF